MYNFPTHIAYYKDLHLDRIRSLIYFGLKPKPIVYGIRCRVTNMIYIGSTLHPYKRLFSHLETGNGSNIPLQKAITKYGLKYFNLYIFEILTVNTDESYAESIIRLRNLEQSYINKFTRVQLYNVINAASN